MPDKSKVSILMIGFAVPDHLIDEIRKVDRYLPVQTHKLSWAVINGLEANDNVIVDLVSTLPISTFPNCKKILAKYTRWDRGNNSHNVLIPFVNILGIKHLSRFISCLFFVFKWAINTRNAEKRCILLYSLNSALSYAGLLVSRLCNIKITALVTDPPSADLSGEIRLTKILRKIDRVMIVNAMQRMDGLIVLVKSLAENFAPKVPYLVMEGVLRQDDINVITNSMRNISTEKRKKFTVMYAGGVSSAYGIELLLRAFELLEEDDYQLWIFGGGPMENCVREAMKNDQRIFFGGVVSNTDILARLLQASVLINPRPTNQEFTLYSFPSKTIEYLVSGRPVLSTRLKGIPSEYFQFLIPIDVETPEGIAAVIRMARSKTADELDKIGNAGRNFVIEHKNELVQGKASLGFLLDILNAK